MVRICTFEVFLRLNEKILVTALPEISLPECVIVVVVFVVLGSDFLCQMAINLVSSPQLLLDAVVNAVCKFVIVCEKGLLFILHGTKHPIHIFPHILTSQLATTKSIIFHFYLPFTIGSWSNASVRALNFVRLSSMEYCSINCVNYDQLWRSI